MTKYYDKYEITINDTELKNYKGIKDLKSFFSNIIKNFAEESFDFYKEWEEFPFVYRERQVNSALIPAIHKYTNTIWLEQPFKKDGNEQRFLDIATAKNKNLYLIELKHSFKSKTEKIDERSWNEWDTGIEQIATIKSDTLGEHYTSDLNIFKIALMIMPTYLTYSDKDNDLLCQTSATYNEHIFKSFKNKDELHEHGFANLVGTIKINKPSNYPHEWSNGKQIYPFLSFIIRVDPLKT